MIGELGQLALCFALALSLVMAISGLIGARANAATARALANGSAMGMLVFTLLAFGVLTWAFVTSDFSVQLVADHSSTLKPLVYKISGVWGNHEGSMLLWVLVLALYAGLVAALQRGGARLTSAALGRFAGQVANFAGHLPGEACYRCFVGDAFDAEDCDTCAEQGVLGAMVGMVGAFAAMQAIRVLLTGASTLGDSQWGKLHLVDGLAPSLRTMRIPKDPGCRACGSVA